MHACNHLLTNRRKKVIKEQNENILDKMWCCVIRFCPWEPNKHKVIFKEVNIIEAHSTDDGIYVVSDWEDPFLYGTCETVCGYYNKISVKSKITGFFDTEEDARRAYKKLMEEWISVIRNTME